MEPIELTEHQRQLIEDFAEQLHDFKERISIACGVPSGYLNVLPIEQKHPTIKK